MALFNKDFVRSLVLGFVLGSAAMVFVSGAEPAHAAAAPVETAAR